MLRRFIATTLALLLVLPVLAVPSYATDDQSPVAEFEINLPPSDDVLYMGTADDWPLKAQLTFENPVLDEAAVTYQWYCAVGDGAAAAYGDSLQATPIDDKSTIFSTEEFQRPTVKAGIFTYYVVFTYTDGSGSTHYESNHRTTYVSPQVLKLKSHNYDGPPNVYYYFKGAPASELSVTLELPGPGGPGETFAESSYGELTYQWYKSTEEYSEWVSDDFPFFDQLTTRAIEGAGGSISYDDAADEDGVTVTCTPANDEVGHFNYFVLVYTKLNDVISCTYEIPDAVIEVLPSPVTSVTRGASSAAVNIAVELPAGCTVDPAYRYMLLPKDADPGEDPEYVDGVLTDGAAALSFTSLATGAYDLYLIFTCDDDDSTQWPYKASIPVYTSGSGGGAATPVAGGTAAVNYTTTKGTASLVLPTNKVNEIIEKAKDDEAVIDLSKASGITAASLPKDALAAFAKAGLDATVKLPTGTITFDEDAAASVAKQAAGSNLSAELKQMAVSSLTDAQKEAVKTGDIVLDINIASGEKKISTFDGKLTIQIPYTGPQPVAVWYLNDKGELEKLPCTVKNGVVSFDLHHLSLYVIGRDDTATAWMNPFTDVKQNDWFYDAVKYVNENGLMNGTSDTVFGLRGTTTRGMIVTILHRVEGTPVAGTNGFNDVAVGKYYANAVAWVAENKIVQGIGDGKFGPENAITREQLATILMNYAKLKGYDVSARVDLSKFSDEASVSDYAKDAMAWANAAGLIQGDGTKLTPKGNAERVQVAVILQRFMENIPQ